MSSSAPPETSQHLGHCDCADVKHNDKSKLGQDSNDQQHGYTLAASFFLLHDWYIFSQKGTITATALLCSFGLLVSTSQAHPRTPNQTPNPISPNNPKPLNLNPKLNPKLP